LVTVVVFFVNDYLLLENLKNIISFTRFLRKICTNHHYTEKNGAGVTLKWKRENFIWICGLSGRKRDLLHLCSKSLFCCI